MWCSAIRGIPVLVSIIDKSSTELQTYTYTQTIGRYTNADYVVLQMHKYAIKITNNKYKT